MSNNEQKSSKNGDNNSNSNNGKTNGNDESNNGKTTARSSSPNPFLNYLSLSPTNMSPRSDTGSTSASVSPRSPRFQTDYFQNGIKIPNGATQPATAAVHVGSPSAASSMLTSGSLKKWLKFFLTND